MNIVIPMAGRGSRFADLGVAVPKPLIPVHGLPMYAWAAASIPMTASDRLIFICLAEHLTDRRLAADIQERFGQFKPRIVMLDQVTQGQACTVLAAKAWIDSDEPLIIFNADTYAPTALPRALDRWGGQVDGALDVFQAAGDKWSFAKIDADFRVVETAEKRRISEWATTGLYYFRRGADFVRHARNMIDDDERTNREFYVAPVYNRLIAAGADIRANPTSDVWVLGTPEDLQYFLEKYPGTAPRRLGD